jgi:hypothetical protein
MFGQAAECSTERTNSGIEVHMKSTVIVTGNAVRPGPSGRILFFDVLFSLLIGPTLTSAALFGIGEDLSVGIFGIHRSRGLVHRLDLSIGGGGLCGTTGFALRSDLARLKAGLCGG